MKIFCLEDNALVVMHLEMVVEDAGHQLVGSAASFSEAKALWRELDFDLALVDIDLTDGKTGIDAAEWLRGRGRLCCFVTGQAELAGRYSHLVMAIVPKPIDEAALRAVFADAAAQLAAAPG